MFKLSKIQHSKFNLKSLFIKKIPIKILPKSLKDFNNYMNRQLKLYPFSKDYPTTALKPWLNQPPYYGINPDMRYYELYYDGNQYGKGEPISEKF